MRRANIFVLVDALGWEWVRQHPFLCEAAPYRRRLESVLGYSTAAIPSILTGLYPEQHGRFTLFQRALGPSPFANLRWIAALPAPLAENKYVRYAAKLVARRTNHFEGWFHFLGVPLRYLPLLDICEKHNIYAPSGIPGSTTIFDLAAARGVGAGVYSYHDGSNAELIDRIKSDLRNAKCGFYFLYLDGIDGFLHAHAQDSAACRACLTQYSDAISAVYEIARSNYGEVNLHVFGDHGMAPTERYIDLRSRLEQIPVRAPRDYLCVLDSTMARFWFFSERARSLIMPLLSRADGGHWMCEQELRELHAWFDDKRFGEEIYLLPEGAVFASPRHGDIVPRGMHGFHPSTLHSPAAFLSSTDYGTAINHITDIFRLMRDAL
jgi:hypothetical protein